jgi:DNA polymerase-4
LRPLGWEPDLFVPEGDARQRRLQEAVDKVKNRYGMASLTTGLVLAASKKGTGTALPSPAAYAP